MNTTLAVVLALDGEESSEGYWRCHGLGSCSPRREQVKKIELFQGQNLCNYRIYGVTLRNKTMIISRFLV